MDAHLSIDVEGNIMFQTACIKLTVLVVVVSWCRQQSISGRMALVHFAGALTGIRYHHVILHKNIRGTMFQHNKARTYVAHVSQEFLQCHNIQIVRWPAGSPDLNPIEHLWDALDQCVHQRNQPLHTLLQLLLTAL